MAKKILMGIDIVLASPPSWKGKRIGLVTNNAAVTSHFVASRTALLSRGFNVVKLFSRNTASTPQRQTGMAWGA